MTVRRDTFACSLQADFEKRVNPNDKAQTDLLEEMRAHVKKVYSIASPGFEFPEEI